MVRKLMKHELAALFRVLLYIGAIVLVLAVLTRIGYALTSGPFFGISLIFFFAGIFAMLACAVYASVQRFWASFFTGEGYMTFSLPATPAQILIAKLLSAIIAMFFGTLVTIISILIVTSGLPSEIWAQIAERLGMIFERLVAYISSEPLIAIEYGVLLIVSIPMSLLFFYSVMSVGQLLTKGRKGWTVVIFLALYWAVSLINMLFYMPFLDTIYENFGIHAYLLTEIGVTVALELGMFFLVRYILMHKVNLII